MIYESGKLTSVIDKDTGRPEFHEIQIRGNLKIKYRESAENCQASDFWVFWYGIYIDNDVIWKNRLVLEQDENFVQPTHDFMREVAKIGVSKWLKATGEVIPNL